MSAPAHRTAGRVSDLHTGGMLRSSAHRLATDLVSLCRGTAPSRESAGSVAFRTHVRHHRLAPLAHVVLVRGHGSAGSPLHQDFLNAVGGHTRNLVALRSISGALADLPWSVLKGPVLSELAHPVPGVRSYADLDVLVRPADLPRAIEALAEVGWVLMEGDHALVLERLPGEVHMLGPHGAQVDLHWSLVNNRAARASFTLSPAAMLERRVERRIESLSVPTLDDVDVLLHLCLHAGLAGADRLLWLLDVDQWVRRSPLDWNEFLLRTQGARAQSIVLVVLGRTVRTLGTPVPEDVLVSLDPAGVWRRLEWIVTTVQPPATLRRTRSLPRFVARSSRGSAAKSLEHLIRRGLWAPFPRTSAASTWDARPNADAWQTFLDRVAQME
jgi:hypothetical protein